MAENNKDLDMPCKHKNHTGLKHIGLKLEVNTARVNGLLDVEIEHVLFDWS